MNIFEAIVNRRSVREFIRDKPVDDKLIGVMLHMATQAPSAGNMQDWEFVVVKDEELKKRIAFAALRQNFIAEAPVVIVVCSNLNKISMRYGERGERMYSLQDTSYASMNILLSATTLGLGSCLVAAFDEESVRSILSLPETLRPVAIIPIGYSDEKPEQPKRIPFETLTSINTYGRKYQVSLAVQPGPEPEAKFKPFGTYIEEVLRKWKKEKPKEKKGLEFEDLLKKLLK